MVLASHALQNPSRYLSVLLDRAHELGASDIHLEATPEALNVRLRVDGRLQVHTAPAPAIREAVLSRIKILANLDIARAALAARW